MRRVLALAVAMLAVGGCAIGPDDSPRDIDQKVIDDLPLSPSGAGAAATGAGRIYLLAPDANAMPAHLQAVARDVGSDPTALLQALFAGPNREELDDQLRTALPPELTLLSVRRRGAGVLHVDLSEEITRLSGDALIDAVAQIVFTSSALPAVKSVVIAVNGMATQWPAGNGELRSEALTVYDYPGHEPSTQPAFPGIPSAG